MYNTTWGGGGGVVVSFLFSFLSSSVVTALYPVLAGRLKRSDPAHVKYLEQLPSLYLIHLEILFS